MAPSPIPCLPLLTLPMVITMFPAATSSNSDFYDYQIAAGNK